jgi:hypothetical protein
VQVLPGGDTPKDYKPVNGQPFAFRSVSYLITTCSDAPAIDLPVRHTDVTLPLLCFIIIIIIIITQRSGLVSARPAVFGLEN